MNDLELARKKISEIDTKMAFLFEERMRACEAVASFKKERGLAIRDEERETAMVQKYRNFVSDDTIASYYINFLKSTIDISCAYQERLMDGMKVAYCGVEGAYAYIASKKMFPSANRVACKDFAEAYHRVQDGTLDCAVLPIENSVAGEIGEVLDLIFSGDLSVNQVLEMPIRHNLLGLPGAKVEEIKTVISHPQAIEQCIEWIRAHGMTAQNCSNTAVAAKSVLEKNDPTVAAIASDETASLYGLKVLESGINDRFNNTTRFVALSRVANRPTKKTVRENENFILVFTVENKAGALAQTLNMIGAHGYNMRALRSRPMKDLPWRYYFYIEAEGDIHTQNGESLLQELSAVCARLKLVGTYCTESEK